MSKASESPRVELLARLRAHQGELADTILAGVRDALSDPAEGDDANDLADLRAAISAVLDHGFDGIEREAERSPEQRRAVFVQRLLDSRPLDAAELDYELDAWHLGAIATGANAEQALRRLAAGLDRRLLSVPGDDGAVWAWLGGGRLTSTDIERVPIVDGLADVSLAVGEPGRGSDGWRLTHQQARAALLVALRRPRRLTRYRDVALLALAPRDETTARSFVELYLSPLDDRRGSGTRLRETLRAYFATGRVASAAAAKRGISRRTMRNHMVAIEQRLGSLLDTHQAELELALRLEELREDNSAVDA